MPNDIKQGYSDIGIYYNNNKNSSNTITKKFWAFPISVICSSQFDMNSLNFLKENQNLNISSPHYLMIQIVFITKIDEINSRKNIIFNHKIEAVNIGIIKKSVVSNYCTSTVCV